MAELTVGTRWRSAVCDTEIVIVRTATPSVDLRCGGVSVLPHDAARDAGAPPPPEGAGAVLGKRYVHAGTGLEVLCTKGGKGALTVGEEPLDLKSAKPLPASD